MPLVTVLTPTRVANADHLLAAWESIRSSRLPRGWELEWVVQEDGEAPSLRARLAEDPRIRYDAVGTRLGAPTTRNLGLTRARGELVAGLDHDDEYLPGGLDALVTALAADAGAGWACGRARLLMEDGGTWTKPDVHAPGRIAPGALGRRFVRTGDWPFPSAFAMYRRRPLEAAGGWPAVPRSDDAALLLAFSFRYAGVWIPRELAVYRRWSAQASIQPVSWALRAHPTVEPMLRRRFAALEGEGL